MKNPNFLKNIIKKHDNEYYSYMKRFDDYLNGSLSAEKLILLQNEALEKLHLEYHRLSEEYMNLLLDKDPGGEK